MPLARLLTLPDVIAVPGAALADTTAAPVSSNGCKRGASAKSLSGFGGVPDYSPQKGCRGKVPAGGLGVSPNSPFPLTRGAGVSLPGVWGVSTTFPYSLKGGAGVSLPGVWGCPPTHPLTPSPYLQPVKRTYHKE